MVGKPDLLDTDTIRRRSCPRHSYAHVLEQPLVFARQSLLEDGILADRSLLAGRPSLFGAQLICSSSALRRASAFL
jgi:hypothetical protein